MDRKLVHCHRNPVAPKGRVGPKPQPGDIPVVGKRLPQCRPITSLIPSNGDSGDGHSRDGGGGDKSQKQKQKTKNQCRIESLKKNRLALGLDIAGIAVEGILAPISAPTAVVVTSVIGVIGIGNAIAHGDKVGVGIAYGGRHAGMAEAFFSGSTGRFLTAASRSLLGLSTLRDIAQAKADYEKCIAGQGG